MAKNIANINIDKNIDKKSAQNIDKSAKKGVPLFFLSAHFSALFGPLFLALKERSALWSALFIEQ